MVSNILYVLYGCVGIKKTLQAMATVQCTNLRVSIDHTLRSPLQLLLHILHLGCVVQSSRGDVSYTLWYLHRLLHWNWTM